MKKEYIIYLGLGFWLFGFVLVLDRAFLHSSVCLETHYLGQAGLGFEITETLLAASWVLRLKAQVTTPDSKYIVITCGSLKSSEIWMSRNIIWKRIVLRVLFTMWPREGETTVYISIDSCFSTWLPSFKMYRTFGRWDQTMKKSIVVLVFTVNGTT